MSEKREKREKREERTQNDHGAHLRLGQRVGTGAANKLRRVAVCGVRERHEQVGGAGRVIEVPRLLNSVSRGGQTACRRVKSDNRHEREESAKFPDTAHEKSASEQHKQEKSER